MCVGIPGQLVQVLHGDAHLARVSMSGVARTVDVGLLEDEHLVPGDWVLIHVGVAMSKISEEGAARALAVLQLLGHPSGDELESFWSSQVDEARGA